MDTQNLIEVAKEARKLSYSPYSHFAVGAAVLCSDGSVYPGANIENASYPLSMCAERNAVYNAYMDEKTKDDIIAICIIADSDRPCSPCGACRQVLSELIPEDALIIMVNLKGDKIETTIKDLLPYAFQGDDL